MSLLTNPWFSAGMGLLASSGPSLTPVNPWGGIATGLMNASEAQAYEQQNRYAEMRARMEEETMKRGEARQAQLEQMMAGLPENQRIAATLAPDKFGEMYAAQQFPTAGKSARIATAGELGLAGYAPETPIEVMEEGGRVVDYSPMTPPAAATPPTDIQLYNLYKSQGGEKDLMGWLAEKSQVENAGGGGGPDPYYQFLPTANGYAAGNARTGTVAMVAGPEGEPLVRATDDPELQEKIAGGKAYGGTLGEEDAAYWATRPTAKAARSILLRDLKELKSAPGLESIFGNVQGRTPDIRSSARDARARLDKVVAGLALEGRQKLEGSGAISDFESRMLKSASTVLQDSSISDEMAITEVTKIIDDLESGRFAPGAPSSMAPNKDKPPVGEIKFLGFE